MADCWLCFGMWPLKVEATLNWLITRVFMCSLVLWDIFGNVLYMCSTLWCMCGILYCILTACLSNNNITVGGNTECICSICRQSDFLIHIYLYKYAQSIFVSMLENLSPICCWSPSYWKVWIWWVIIQAYTIDSPESTTSVTTYLILCTFTTHCMCIFPQSRKEKWLLGKYVFIWPLMKNGFSKCCFMHFKSISKQPL